jgi:hypothetical protein
MLHFRVVWFDVSLVIVLMYGVPNDWWDEIGGMKGERWGGLPRPTSHLSRRIARYVSC